MPLTIADRERLVEAARAARDSAYAPYSGYAVGAAVLAASGRLYCGCNVENASFGLTVCAERVAIFCAVSSGERVLTALALVTASAPPALPCGACLQVLNEFAANLPVLLVGADCTAEETTLRRLLPRGFRDFRKEA